MRAGTAASQGLRTASTRLAVATDSRPGALFPFFENPSLCHDGQQRLSLEHGSTASRSRCCITFPAARCGVASTNASNLKSARLQPPSPQRVHRIEPAPRPLAALRQRTFRSYCRLAKPSTLVRSIQCFPKACSDVRGSNTLLCESSSHCAQRVRTIRRTHTKHRVRCLCLTIPPQILLIARLSITAASVYVGVSFLQPKEVLFGIHRQKAQRTFRPLRKVPERETRILCVAVEVTPLMCRSRTPVVRPRMPHVCLPRAA